MFIEFEIGLRPWVEYLMTGNKFGKSMFDTEGVELAYTRRASRTRVHELISDPNLEFEMDLEVSVDFNAASLDSQNSLEREGFENKKSLSFEDIIECSSPSDLDRGTARFFFNRRAMPSIIASNFSSNLFSGFGTKDHDFAEIYKRSIGQINSVLLNQDSLKSYMESRMDFHSARIQRQSDVVEEIEMKRKGGVASKTAYNETVVLCKCHGLDPSCHGVPKNYSKPLISDQIDLATATTFSPLGQRDEGQDIRSQIGDMGPLSLLMSCTELADTVKDKLSVLNEKVSTGVETLIQAIDFARDQFDEGVQTLMSNLQMTKPIFSLVQEEDCLDSVLDLLYVQEDKDRASESGRKVGPKF